MKPQTRRVELTTMTYTQHTTQSLAKPEPNIVNVDIWTWKPWVADPLLSLGGKAVNLEHPPTRLLTPVTHKP